MNIFAHGIARQPTSAAMLVSGADIFTNAGVRQSTPTSAYIINTPPTFGGITSRVPNVNGSILVGWASATSTKNPVKYAIYCALGSVSAATLFGGPNLVAYAPDSVTGVSIWTLGDLTTFLVNGATYTVGVKAIDAIGIVDVNMVVMTTVAIGSGNLPQVLQQVAIDLAATEVLLVADHVAFQADHVNFQSDHANFVADDAAFDADHANFVADHAALSGTEVLLAQDHVNLNQDHLNFLNIDHANFVADHANFVADHAALSGTEVLLAQDHVNFQSDHANFVADDAAFDADHANFVADHAALSGTEVLLAQDHVNLNQDHLNFLNIDHANFVADHANFVADHAALSGVAGAVDYDIASMLQSDLTGIIGDDELTADI